MRRRIAIVLIPVLGLAAVCPLLAQSTDPWLGTWKLDLAQSVFRVGAVAAPRSLTYTHEPAEGGLKATVDVVDAQGQVRRTLWAGKYDGEFYPVQALQGTLHPNPTRSYRRVGERTYWVMNRSGDRILNSLTLVVSPDGKTMTQTLIGQNVDGQPIDSTLVFVRQ